MYIIVFLAGAVVGAAINYVLCRKLIDMKNGIIEYYETLSKH